jgi:hypothetical protein
VIVTKTHARKHELPIWESGLGDLIEKRYAEWGGFRVEFESIRAGFDAASAFSHLPGGACDVPHWGYVFAGEVAVRYSDGREEVVGAGEAFYMAPGHVTRFLEDTELVEFTPADLLEQRNRLLSRARE